MNLGTILKPFHDKVFFDESVRSSVQVVTRTTPTHGVGYAHFCLGDQSVRVRVVSRRPGPPIFSIKTPRGFVLVDKDDVGSRIVSMLGLGVAPSTNTSSVSRKNLQSVNS